MKQSDFYSPTQKLAGELARAGREVLVADVEHAARKAGLDYCPLDVALIVKRVNETLYLTDPDYRAQSAAVYMGHIFSRSERDALIDMALIYRLQNYGYGWRDFASRSTRASRYRSKLRIYRGQPFALDFSGGWTRRITWHGARPKYTVGQSANEEIVGIMQAMLPRRGGRAGAQ